MLINTIGLLVFSFLQMRGSLSHKQWDGNKPGESTCYTTEVLLNTTSPIHIAISHHTQNIYFLDRASRLKVIKKGEDNPEQIYIQESTIKTVEVDNFNPTVYIGCSNGLKIYYERSGIIENVQNFTQDIEEIFLAKHSSAMYAVISTKPEYKNRVFVYDSIASKGINTNVTIDRMFLRNFVVDSEGNYYLRMRKDKDHSVLVMSLKGNRTTMEFEDGDKLNQLAVDSQGKVYATTSRKVYRLLPGNQTPQFVTSLDFYAVSMCFDGNDNLLFGSQSNKSLVRLILDSECTSPRPLSTGV